MVAFFFHTSTKTENGGASSKEGFKGILKKICILLLVGLAHELDYIMEIEYTRALAILFFLGNEGLSILENMGLMGVKYPELVKKALEVIKDKGESGGDKGEDV
jgi:toxin secretion/phage lysis holin